MGDGDSIDVFNVEFSVAEGLMNDRKNSLDVATGGDFRNHATVGGVDIDLGNDDVRKESVAIFNNGGSGFIA